MQTTRTSQVAGWRGWKRLSLGLLPLLLAAGCQSRAGTGALVGGGAGALLGNAVAKAAGGSRTAGTAIGGILGAGLGAAAGDSVDHNEKRAEARGRATAAAQQNSLRAPTLQDIAEMSRRGTPDDLIINQIRTTGATYPTLSSQDILYLRDATVSSRVIGEMQISSATVVAPRVYSEHPHYPTSMSGGVIYRSR